MFTNNFSSEMKHTTDALIVNQAGEIYETRNDLYLLLARKF